MTTQQKMQYTVEEVAKHNKEGDIWIIIDSKVYDVSKFLNLHPGGSSVLLDPEIVGQDATEAFFSLHRYEVLLKPQYARLQIGFIKDSKPVIKPRGSGEVSHVPYAEPTWLSNGFYSPYFNDSHRRLQKAWRKFVDEIIYPDAQAREEDGKRPSQSVMDAMAAQNIIPMRMGPGKHLKGLTLMNGIVTPEEFTYTHEMVMNQESARTGARGYTDGLLAGAIIGLPPVLNFGRPELQQRIVPEVLQAKKFICLAISEAFAGSDVAGMKTTASKTQDGKHWIVNGTKKWITNGTYADYFTVGCRTKVIMKLEYDPKTLTFDSQDAYVVLLIERGEGVETKPIKTSYSPAACTAYITFDNVNVPVENTLGPENGGLNVILSNFNHERWVMCCTSISAQRCIVEECIKWVNQRKVFGKPLVSQAVIRSKLAQMIARVESAQNWLENVTFQMDNMDYKQQSDKLAGQIAFLKMYSTRTSQETAEDAVQIFGGRGITRTGMGRFIEHYHRTVPFDAVLGGAEDVLADLGVRQAIRKMPKGSRL